MELFSCFACCSKRSKNPNIADNYPLNDFSVLKSKRLLALYYDFEDKLGELKTISITDFIKEARLLTSYDDSLST